MAHACIKLLIVVVILIIIAGCSNTGTAPASSAKELNPQFDSFKKNFVLPDLPLTIKACYTDGHKFEQLTKEKYPLYVTNEEGYVLSGYTLKTNGDFTALLSFFPADCFVPYLTTYDRGGKKIDGKMIAIGGCGSDCGFTCEEFMIIRADYSIYTSDTVTYIKCDTAGNEIPGTKEHYVIYKNGKLLSSGKIELSGEVKEMLKD